MLVVLSDDLIEDIRGCVVAEYVLSGISGTYTSETFGEFVIPYDGTYFYNADGARVSSLTAPPSVHQFDPALIPTSGGEEFVVKFEMGDDGIVADATWEDVTMAAYSGKLAKGIFYEEGIPYRELQFTSGGFISVGLSAPNTLEIMSIGYDGTPVWAFNVKEYTLTPDT